MKISKNYILVSRVIAIIALVAFFGWLIFDLTIDDSKGEENAVKSVAKIIYYQAAAAMIPISPAIELSVPFHRQQHSLSCEAAALTMALNYKGVKVTENELINQLPVSDPGPRQSGNIWGDPNLGFVGNINGSMPNTGYGVYEKPIFDLATKYRSAKIMSNATITDLITELSNNNPIVVWGVIGKGKDISWKTPAGKVIVAKLDEHARTLIGFTGSSNNPKQMILLDPIYGKIRMSISAFQKNWDMLADKAVVIY
ncbi:MAG: C39 family peptidase [Patescibacteria group bacterium]